MNTYVLVIIISLILSAFFSGMEIAFVSSNKLRLELDKKQKKFYTKIIDIFIKKPSTYISTMLVGNNIALVVYGIAFAKLFEEPICTMLGTDSDSVVLLTQTILSTLIVLITAEFLPKTVCKINPNGVLRTFAIVALFFYVLLFPISRFTSWLANIFLRLMGKKVDKTQRQTIFKRSDLVQLTSEVAEHEEDNEHEHDIRIFQNALEFPDVKIRDCMIPRTEIEAISENGTIEELKQICIASGFSRIMVFRESMDNIIGYVNAKDLFKKTETLSAITRPVRFVPETMQAEKLLQKFIHEHQSIAVVVDEFGGTAGLISIEDILEEIFGDIEDEHDSDELIEKQTGDNKFVFSGRLEVEYLNTTYELNIPENEEYETLAGYILYSNENIPKAKEIIEIDDFEIKVLRTLGSRLDLVQLIKKNNEKTKK